MDFPMSVNILIQGLTPEIQISDIYATYSKCGIINEIILGENEALIVFDDEDDANGCLVYTNIGEVDVEVTFSENAILDKVIQRINYVEIRAQQQEKNTLSASTIKEDDDVEIVHNQSQSHQHQAENVHHQAEPIHHQTESVQDKTEPVHQQPKSPQHKSETVHREPESVHSQPEPLKHHPEPVHHQHETVKQHSEVVHQEHEPVHHQAESTHDQTESVLSQPEIVHEEIKLPESVESPKREQSPIKQQLPVEASPVKVVQEVINTPQPLPEVSLGSVVHTVAYTDPVVTAEPKCPASGQSASSNISKCPFSSQANATPAQSEECKSQASCTKSNGCSSATPLDSVQLLKALKNASVIKRTPLSPGDLFNKVKDPLFIQGLVGVLIGMTAYCNLF